MLTVAATRRNGARWSVAFAIGVRQSEAIGLRWHYVDLDEGTIEVGWQLKRARFRHGCGDPAKCAASRHRRPCPRHCTRHRHQPGCPDDCTTRGHRCPEVKRPCPPGCGGHSRECPQRTGGGWHFTRRKGVKPGQGKAKLVLALPPLLIKQLRAHRRQQAAERLTAGAAWQDWDLVFCTTTGTPIDSRDDWVEWHGLLTDAGIRPARVHDARHTAATLLQMGRVASDATFPGKREDGTVRDLGPRSSTDGCAAWRETPGQHGCVRTGLRQTQRCCIGFSSVR
jgi:integrase